ncbi:MAG: hypothetical protein QOE61_343, partial [Micromonosporaceae bacterium]|nr:hypothetical protein [Micromonosporaceae bacterium]
MSRLRSTAGDRPQQFAYFIALPLFLLTVAFVVPLAENNTASVKELPLAAVYLVFFILAQLVVLHFEVRRHSFVLTLTEIPLVLALFYLSPLVVIMARVLSLVLLQLWKRYPIPKILFNVSSSGLAATAAAHIVAANPVRGNVKPGTWLILTGAVGASTVISLAAVIGVISLVQGIPPVRSLFRTSVSVVAVAAVNIAVGLVVLLVLAIEP